jgi:hypothetical protein
MIRHCYLTKLERLNGLCRWCERRVALGVAYRSDHDPG